MLPKNLLEYAKAYENARSNTDRCDKYQGVFLPLEILKEKETGISHLSVSLSGTGIKYKSTFITQHAEFIRIVQIKLKWLVLPATVSKLFTKGEFAESFADCLAEKVIEGEPFWVISEDQNESFKSKIKSYRLDNSHLDLYDHEYFNIPE